MTDTALRLVPPPPPQVTYWAISILSSRTFWLNAAAFVLAALSLSDVTAVIPVRFLPLEGAAVAMLNLYLRTMTVRPVAFIAPGTTLPIQVPRIGPVPPPAVRD
jgi:hypothetical protein